MSVDYWYIILSGPWCPIPHWVMDERALLITNRALVCHGNVLLQTIKNSFLECDIWAVLKRRAIHALILTWSTLGNYIINLNFSVCVCCMRVSLSLSLLLSGKALCVWLCDLHHRSSAKPPLNITVSPGTHSRTAYTQRERKVCVW